MKTFEEIYNSSKLNEGICKYDSTLNRYYGRTKDNTLWEWIPHKNNPKFGSLEIGRCVYFMRGTLEKAFEIIQKYDNGDYGNI